MASYAAITAIGQPVYAADLEAEYEQQQPQPQPQPPQTNSSNNNNNGNNSSNNDTDNEGDDENQYESEQFLDSLDEVHTRFLLNVPQEELSTSERIFFQLEQAWWYYEDLICDKLEAEQQEKNESGSGSCPLPRFANLKPFSKRLFEFSPLLAGLDFHKLWKEFAIYKRKISTYGCILLNRECTHLVLCKMYKSNTWTFPAGKINQNEIGIDAAAREVYEETGFDPHCLLGGLTKKWLDEGDPDQKIRWNRPLRDPEDALTFVEQPSGKRRTCYVCCGVPEDFPFEPVCRKEIDYIEWIHLKDIKEYKTFAVTPFIGKLRKWIRTHHQKKHKKQQQRTNASNRNKSREKSRPKSRPKSNGRDKSSQKTRRRNSKSLMDAGLIGSMGESTRWTEEEMFETNSKLQGGRICAYDGNPHEFAEKGFGVDDEATGSQRIDPHSFRVVGGSFMNSEHGDKIAKPTDPEQMARNYQPLVRDDHTSGSGGGGGGSSKLLPFFSQHGETPWGATVDEVKSDPGDLDNLFSKDDSTSNYYEDDDGFAQETPKHKKPTKSSTASQELLARLQTNSNPMTSSQNAEGPVSGDYDYNDDGGMMIFATDKQITAKKQRDYEQKQQQQQKQKQQRQEKLSPSKQTARSVRWKERKEQLIAQMDADMAFVNDWVKSLPNPVNFQIPSVDAILDQHYGTATAATTAKAVGARVT